MDDKNNKNSNILFPSFKINLPDFNAAISANINDSLKGFYSSLASFSKKFTTMFQDIWDQVEVGESLAKEQFVMLSPLPQNWIVKIKNANESEINQQLLTLLKESNFEYLETTVCRTKKKMSKNRHLEIFSNVFEQSVKNYYNKCYDVVIITLCSVVDGILSNLSGKSDTRLKAKVNSMLRTLSGLENSKNQITEEELEIFPITEYQILRDYSTVCNSIFAFVDFTQDDFYEPNNINRNCILHGRTKYGFTKLDCVKMFNFIYATILVFEDD